MSTCPNCARGPLAIEKVKTFAAQPVGGFSLAGFQMKLSAREEEKLRLRCTSCNWAVFGTIEDPVLAEDGVTFIGGHFAAEVVAARR